MGFFSGLLYIIISFVTGSALIFVSINYLDVDYIENLLSGIHSDPLLRILTGLIGAWIILRCVNTIKNTSDQKRREKTIAYEGEFGQVTISLSALEDTIKRLLKEINGLKEVKPQVIASKKGLKVILRLVLSSTLNIPELTEKVQGIVRDKLQSMLGIEEELQIQVEIKKILFPEPKKNNKKNQDDSDDTAVPYRDYQP